MTIFLTLIGIVALALSTYLAIKLIHLNRIFELHYALYQNHLDLDKEHKRVSAEVERLTPIVDLLVDHVSEMERTHLGLHKEKVLSVKPPAPQGV